MLTQQEMDINAARAAVLRMRYFKLDKWLEYTLVSNDGNRTVVKNVKGRTFEFEGQGWDLRHIK
jgi:IS1 family transposase